MVNGLKFPSRLHDVEPQRDTGTKEERLCGWPLKRVDDLNHRRDVTTRARGNPSSSLLESTGEKSSVRSRVSVRTGNRHRWVRRVASGERVKRGQGTRHNDPVTSEEGMSELV